MIAKGDLQAFPLSACEIKRLGQSQHNSVSWVNELASHLTLHCYKTKNDAIKHA